MNPKVPWLDGDPPARSRLSPRRLWLSPRAALVALIAFVVATTAVTYTLARHWMTDSIQRELSSVAHIKSEQIQTWLEERHRDARLVITSPEFTRRLQAWLAAGRPPELAKEFALEMQPLAESAQFSRLCLRSAEDGAPLFGEQCAPDTPALHDMAIAAARGNALKIEDFPRSAPGDILSVGMLLPITLTEGKRPAAVAHFSVDPGNSLFPTLQRWLGASPSAEVLLIRRDGDDVVFLNTLRYGSDAPPTLRRRLADDPTLLATQAITGQTGMLYGRDYRGVASVGYATPVPETPWLLLAKMDRSEADAWLNRLTIAVVASLAMVVIAGFWWWTERQRHVANLHAHDLARAVLSERMDYLSRHTHDCIVLIDLDGRILDTNESCQRIYGYSVEEMLARDGKALLADARPDGNLRALWQQLDTAGDLVVEGAQAHKSGEALAVEISMRAFKAADARCIQAIVRDVTERKRAEARIEDLYQNAPCGYHSLDDEGRFCLINDTELSWLGYRREEVVGRVLVTDLLTPESQRVFAGNFPRLSEKGYLRDLELDFVCKDGRILPTLVNATAIYDDDGKFLMSRSAMLDLTENRALKEERERQTADLEALSRRLISVQEDERRRLSAELHDRTSPNLAALDINLRSLARRLPAGSDAEATMLLDDATALLADTAESIREVCADLRPPILDYAGLLAAMQSYVQQFSVRTGIVVNLNFPDEPMRFAPELESTLFRIAQEALTNCAKHAAASQVCVCFELHERQVCLEITDDGVGFTMPPLGDEGSGPGLGLISMRERAQFAGGSVHIDSLPGRGTHLRVCIPVDMPVSLVERRRQAPMAVATRMSDASLDSIARG